MMDADDPRRQQQEAHKHDFEVWAGDRRNTPILDSTSYPRAKPITPPASPEDVEFGHRVMQDAIAAAGIQPGNISYGDLCKFSVALLKRLGVKP